MAMISTARRSPRYLGKYDEGAYDEDQEIKEQQPTLITARKDTVTIDQSTKQKITIQDDEAETKRDDKKKKTKKTTSIKVATK